MSFLNSIPYLERPASTSKCDNSPSGYKQLDQPMGHWISTISEEEIKETSKVSCAVNLCPTFFPRMIPFDKSYESNLYVSWRRSSAVAAPLRSSSPGNFTYILKVLFNSWMKLKIGSFVRNSCSMYHYPHPMDWKFQSLLKGINSYLALNPSVSDALDELFSTIVTHHSFNLQNSWSTLILPEKVLVSILRSIAWSIGRHLWDWWQIRDQRHLRERFGWRILPRI